MRFILGLGWRLSDEEIAALGGPVLSPRIDPDIEPQPDVITGSTKQVVSQLRDLLGLGFTGFNFIVSGPGQIANIQRIAEDVLSALRSAGRSGP